MSLITITGIRAFGFHGVYDDERRNGQEFVVDVAMRVDTTAAEKSDSVHDSVHYGEVAEQVAKVVTGEPVALIETLAARIADLLMLNPKVQGVDVTVHKPNAPISVGFSDVSVTITR